MLRQPGAQRPAHHQRDLLLRGRGVVHAAPLGPQRSEPLAHSPPGGDHPGGRLQHQRFLRHLMCLDDLEDMYFKILEMLVVF